MTSKFKLERWNPYLISQSNNPCKYELIVYGKVKKWLITSTINREAVLVDFINRAYELATQFKIAEYMEFKIMLTEDKVTSVLIDSTIDEDFIKFIYEPITEA